MSAVALYCHKVSQKSLHGLTTLCYKAALAGPSPCLESMTSLCTVFPFSEDQPKYNHPMSIAGFRGSLGASVAVPKPALVHENLPPFLLGAWGELLTLT